MKTLSLTEFKNFCNERSLQKFILTSENQGKYMTQYTVRGRLSFSKMAMSLAPNMICFENGDNYVMLEDVKRVRIVEEQSAIGTIFDVVCKGLFGGAEIAYTFLAE